MSISIPGSSFPAVLEKGEPGSLALRGALHPTPYGDRLPSSQVFGKQTYLDGKNKGLDDTNVPLHANLSVWRDKADATPADDLYKLQSVFVQRRIHPMNSVRTKSLYALQQWLWENRDLPEIQNPHLVRAMWNFYGTLVNQQDSNMEQWRRQIHTVVVSLGGETRRFNDWVDCPAGRTKGAMVGYIFKQFDVTDETGPYAHSITEKDREIALTARGGAEDGSPARGLTFGSGVLGTLGTDDGQEKGLDASVRGGGAAPVASAPSEPQKHDTPAGGEGVVPLTESQKKAEVEQKEKRLAELRVRQKQVQVIFDAAKPGGEKKNAEQSLATYREAIAVLIEQLNAIDPVNSRKRQNTAGAASPWQRSYIPPRTGGSGRGGDTSSDDIDQSLQAARHREIPAGLRHESAHREELVSIRHMKQIRQRSSTYVGIVPWASLTETCPSSSELVDVRNGRVATYVMLGTIQHVHNKDERHRLDSMAMQNPKVGADWTRHHFGAAQVTLFHDIRQN